MTDIQSYLSFGLGLWGAVGIIVWLGSIDNSECWTWKQQTLAFVMAGPILWVYRGYLWLWDKLGEEPKKTKK